MSKIALIFPGQGSQGVGMGKAVYERFPSAHAIYQEANDILGFDLARLCFEGPEEELTLTKNSQPAIYVTSIACLAALTDECAKKGITLEVAAAAGLSLGEFSAHAAVDSFSFADGLRLVRARGEAMQEACDLEPSTMASIIGLELPVVEEICAGLHDRGALGIANLNSPGQVAISGSVDAVHAAMEEAKIRGARKVVELPVSGAFHSPLMKPAEEKLRHALDNAKIQAPRFPVVANVSAGYVTQPAEIRALLLRQLCSPVLWEKSMRLLISEGVSSFMEIGHGRILRGLMRKIDKEQQVMNIQDPESVEATLNSIISM